jgi:hypothetical protein
VPALSAAHAGLVEPVKMWGRGERGARILGMTTKERLHELVDELTEREAGETLRLVVARRQGANVDGWGDLDATTDKTTARIMRDLADEERKAGLTPWRP